MTDPPVITALIADDEDGPRLLLSQALKAVSPGLRIVEAVNGTDAWEAVLEHAPPMCFLDVRMPGLTGIDVAQRIGVSAHVVFVATPSDLAMRALETAGSDCLRKPIDAARVAALMARLGPDLGRSPPDLQALLDRLAGQMRRPAPLEIIRIGIGRDTEVVRTDDVAYFETDGRHTKVVSRSGEGLIRTPVKELVGHLDSAAFVQIDRHRLVNRSFIARLDQASPDEWRLSLSGRPERLAVSDRFRTRVRAAVPHGPSAR